MIGRRTRRAPSPFDAWLEAVGHRLQARWALRLAVRVRRHQNALLAAAIGLGILLMIVHWSGSVRDVRTRAALASPAPHAVLHEGARRRGEPRNGSAEEPDGAQGSVEDGGPHGAP